MAGCWEFQKPEVLLATLTREIVAARWAQGYRALQLPQSAGVSMLSGMPFDCARNMACENMLNNGFTWLLFLDDDVVAPPDTFQRLASHGKDIVSGLYYRRAQPIVPVMLRNVAGQVAAQWVTSWEANKLIEVDLVGAGCLLIHRRVLERVSKPWFDWQIGKEDSPPSPNEPPRPAKLSEDFAFCRKAKEFGFQVHVDTSVVCEHIGLGAAQVGGGFVPSSVA